MRNLILTLALAFSSLFASAQFMVVTTYQAAEEGESWEMSSLTDNMGIGYAVNDKWTLGFIKAGEDSLGESSYDLWGRYNWNDNVYVSVDLGWVSQASIIQKYDSNLNLIWSENFGAQTDTLLKDPKRKFRFTVEIQGIDAMNRCFPLEIYRFV